MVQILHRVCRMTVVKFRIIKIGKFLKNSPKIHRNVIILRYYIDINKISNLGEFYQISLTWRHFMPQNVIFEAFHRNDVIKKQ